MWSAEISGAVEVVQEEFRRGVKAAAVQQVLMGAREPRGLPGAEQAALFAERGVLRGAGAQRLRAVELRQQEVAIGVLGHRGPFYTGIGLG